MALIAGLPLATTICAAESEESSRNSSFEIEDEHLRELTVPEIVNNLRTIEYEDAAARRYAVDDEHPEQTSNLGKKNLEFAKRIATLERSLSIVEGRYEKLLREQQLRRREAGGWQDHDRGLAPSVIYVVASDERIGMAVLSAGAGQGVRPGLLYRVVRDGRVVARLRTVIVRERVAGAKVLDEGREVFPGIGDQAVLGQSAN
jgi:hypothetical protein